MASVNNQKTRHANKAQIRIGTTVIAELVNVSVRQDTGADAVRVIGTAKALEHNHNAENISVTIGKLVFKASKGSKYDLSGDDLLAMEPFNIYATDTTDGEGLFNVMGVTLTGRDTSINSNSRIQSNLTGMALDIRGEGARAVFPVNQSNPTGGAIPPAVA